METKKEKHDENFLNSLHIFKKWYRATSFLIPVYLYFRIIHTFYQNIKFINYFE